MIIFWVLSSLPTDRNQAADKLAKEAFKSSLHQSWSLIMTNFLSAILILDKLNCRFIASSSSVLENSVFSEEEYMLADCNIRASTALMGTISNT